MQLQDFNERFKPHEPNLRFMFDPTKGYLIWQVGTGGNVEITHLRVFEKRKGHATNFMKRFVRLIKPYHSVYVFCLKSNKPALAAYRSFGFEFTEVPNLYRDDGTMLGTVTYTDLCEKLGGD